MGQPRIPVPGEASWFELTAAATASLTIHALLAISAESTEDATSLASTRDAYFPWVTLATTMLDHLVDQAEDQQSGNHSYIAFYPSSEAAALRIHKLIRRCLKETSTLKHSERHIDLKCEASGTSADEALAGIGAQAAAILSEYRDETLDPPPPSDLTITSVRLPRPVTQQRPGGDTPFVPNDLQAS
jgi:hypothetical protein